MIFKKPIKHKVVCHACGWVASAINLTTKKCPMCRRAYSAHSKEMSVGGALRIFGNGNGNKKIKKLTNEEVVEKWLRGEK